MMFASRYRLSPHDAKALRVTDTYSLHRVVYGLFDDVREGDREKGSGILFVDMGGGKYGRQLLILSDRQPREQSCKTGQPNPKTHASVQPRRGRTLVSGKSPRMGL